MIWKEIKDWATARGYKVVRRRADSMYCWEKDGKSGENLDLKEFSTSIFNDMTDNKWVPYQEEYKRKLALPT